MRKYQDPNKAARNRKRLSTHRYGASRRVWEEKDLLRFLDLNQRTETGSYIHPDHEIAKTLKTSLASVQYLRRKANLITKKKIPAEEVLHYMRLSEETLRRL